MARSLHIIKHGKTNSVKNVVDEDSFKKFYEPQGWVLDPSYREVIEINDFEVKTTDETTLKNIAQAKQKGVAKQFDDKIIKGR